MKLKPTDKLIRSEEVIARRINGVVYILDPKNSTIHTLNETASFIWRKLRSPKSSAALARELATAYTVTYKAALKDIDSFLNSYLSQGIVRKNN